MATLPRRHVLRLVTAAEALIFIPRFAKGQNYPSRPVRIVVGTAPASAYDILARLIGQWLSIRLKQPFLIQNLSGGGGNFATEFVAAHSRTVTRCS